MSNKVVDNLYETLKSVIEIKQDYAIISRYQLKQYVNHFSIISFANPKFKQALFKLAKDLGFKYIIYKPLKKKGSVVGKIYFFKTLENELAKSILTLSRIKLFEV